MQPNCNVNNKERVRAREKHSALIRHASGNIYHQK
jgi:hypothetical protein